MKTRFTILLIALSAVTLPVAAQPVLNVTQTPLNYTEDDGKVRIDHTLTLTDASATNMTGVTVQITGNYQNNQDVLGFVNTTNITGNFVPATGILTLTGTTTVSNYQAALRTVTYQDTSELPFGYAVIGDTNNALLFARTVTWTVTDDQSASGNATNLITVRSVNDAPVITSIDSLIITNGNNSGVNIPYNLGLAFSDVDANGSFGEDFTIAITGNSLGHTDTSPKLAGFPVDVSGAVISARQITFTTSPEQATAYCAGLYFQTKKAGIFTVTITANDNGFTGGPPAPSLATSYPQTTVKTITFAWLSTVSGGIDITKPGDTVLATSINSPAGQGATNAIDNSVATKYLNFDKLNTGLTITETNSTVVQGLTLISAEDAPERDPTSYILAGSHDGTNFTTISSNAVPPFITTNSIQSFSFQNTMAYPIYRLIFPTVADPVAANSMQIADVELLAQQEITSSNDVVYETLPPGAVDVRGVVRLIDRQLGLTNKFEVASIPAGDNTVVDLAPAAGASVLSGFELIGGADDVSFPERRPSSFTIQGSIDDTNFTTLSLTVVPAAPSANSQIQEFTVSGYSNLYTHYRLIFGPPVSGDRLQVGEVRLFGTVNNPVWVSASANQFTIQWLAVAGFSVEQNTNLMTESWTTVTNIPTLNGGTNSILLPLDSNVKFFRLNEQ
jgi:hypothetical protein